MLLKSLTRHTLVRAAHENVSFSNDKEVNDARMTQLWCHSLVLEIFHPMEIYCLLLTVPPPPHPTTVVAVIQTATGQTILTILQFNPLQRKSNSYADRWHDLFKSKLEFLQTTWHL
ncbi:hypothetical protein M758_4G023400 [Ceratodon purpureus]|nr:hypothetical protein M758_4G023400 [Ceratodon purpureus]